MMLQYSNYATKNYSMRMLKKILKSYWQQCKQWDLIMEDLARTGQRVLDGVIAVRKSDTSRETALRLEIRLETRPVTAKPWRNHQARQVWLLWRMINCLPFTTTVRQY